jgi:hypothetical protein
MLPSTGGKPEAALGTENVHRMHREVELPPDDHRSVCYF